MGIRHRNNPLYFDVIDTSDKAYWLGFISADGYVVSNEATRNYELSIELSNVDRNHLIKFNQSIDGNYEIIDKTKSPFKNRGYDKIYHLCQIRVYSKHYVDTLAKYGIIPNKTYTLEFYDKLSDNLTWDYVRGYFDGDGSLGKYDVSGHQYVRVSFTCYHKAFLEKLNNFLARYSIIGRLSCDGNNYRMDIRKQDSVKLFFQYIYHNEDCIKLDRKYEKYLTISKIWLPTYQAIGA